MTTPRVRSLVSLAAALTMTLTLGACASAATRQAADRPAPAERLAPTISFDNEAGEYVRVYLVGVRRQWLLGRVEAGAHATLRLPEAAMAEDQRWMRLAVIVGGRASMRAEDDPRAAMTMAQPAATMLEQKWTFARSVATGRLSSLPLSRVRTGGSHE